MEFRDWLMEKFKEWEKTQPNGRSNYSNFARFLGIGVNNYTQWRTGNNLPSYEKALLLSKKLGNEIFGILGYQQPEEPDPWEGFTPALRFALESARDKIISLGITGDSREAEEIITEALSSIGYKRITEEEFKSPQKK